jgi:glycosyltransferase involved in cell wall biosynthesis
MINSLQQTRYEEPCAKGQRTAVRVCFMIDRLSRAGTETQLLALIRSLDRQRVIPHLVLLDGEDELSHSLEPDDCPTLRLGLQSLIGRATLPAIACLARFWRKHRIEILQTYFLDSTYFGVPLAKLSGIRKVIRVRNNLGYWMTDNHRRLGRWMGRLADLTLTNSESGRQALLEKESLHPEKIAVLENGVDLERFPQPEAPNVDGDVVRVGVVANLRPVKNIDGLIRAAALLRTSQPRLRYEVAGEGEQRPELEALLSERNLGDTFALVGSVRDVPSFLMRQDIAVLCSHSEGMSNALLEYMAAGRAIVATDVGANAKLIEHQKSGLVVSAGNDAALAEAIAWLLDHPHEAQTMAANSRKKVEREYSREAMVRRFEALYNPRAHRLVDSSRPSPD